MNKLFTNLFVVLAIFASHGCATTGFGGLSVPGYEVNRVVAGNQAMIWGLANSWQSWYPQSGIGPGMAPTGYYWMCQPKSVGHQWKDVVAVAGVGAGLGGLAAGRRGAIYGGTAGAGGGVLVGNHECDWVLVPIQVPQPPVPPTQPVPSVPTPQPPTPPIPPAAPPVPPMPVLEPAPQRLAGVEFIVVNETSSVLIVEAAGRRAVLKQKAQARVSGTDVRVFLVQPDGKGSYAEFEIDLRGTEDSSLPGWRIPAKVRLKSP